MVRITAFMARLKAYLWALRAPSADAEGAWPSLPLASAQVPSAWRDCSPGACPGASILSDGE